VIDIYNRLRRRKEVEKVTEISEDKFPDVLKNEKISLDIRPVLFQINVDLDSFLYTIPKNRYDFLRTEAEMVLGKSYKDWTVEERKNFLWQIRYEATLIDQHSPNAKDFECMPQEVMTETELRYFRKKKIPEGSLEQLEGMDRKNKRR
jgi:hypothetical protein